MPKRIQRQRTKGWKLPPNTVIVDRTSRFGNPFTVAMAMEIGYADTVEAARALCVVAFNDWVRGGDEWWMGPECDRRRKRLLDGLHLLHGKDVACTCPVDGLPCHGDPLMRLAERGRP